MKKMTDNPIVLAIDPGPERSGWVICRPASAVDPIIACCGDDRNSVFATTLIASLHARESNAIIIEDILPYKNMNSKHLIDTGKWIGRYIEICESRGFKPILLHNPKVRTHLLGRADGGGESLIRDVLLARFGGPEHAIGRKARPGPLGTLRSHAWSAFALAVVWYELQYMRRVGVY